MNDLERITFKKLSLQTWEREKQHRLNGDQLNEGGRYEMFSRIDGPPELKAGLTYVRLNTISSNQGHYALVAAFLTESQERIPRVIEGNLGEDGFFIPDGPSSGAQIRSSDLTQNIGFLTESYFLAPAQAPIQKAQEPKVLYEARNPDRDMVNVY